MDSSLTITPQWIRTHGAKHEAPSGTKNVPLSEADYELIPSMWRDPDSVSIRAYKKLELKLDTVDGYEMVLGVDLYRGAHPTTFYKKNKDAGARPSGREGPKNDVSGIRRTTAQARNEL